jgi:hypothetical protein
MGIAAASVFHLHLYPAAATVWLLSLLFSDSLYA